MTRTKNSTDTTVSYADKLKNPQWQKLRLKIFERDNWTCQECGSKDKTLHAHHKEYIAGNEPWEAPEDTLITLCDDCHGIEKKKKDYLRKINEKLKAIDDIRAYWMIDRTLTDVSILNLLSGFYHVLTDFEKSAYNLGINEKSRTRKVDDL
jgi:5-methylcytosine-specific restriction endonuclease McrA